MQKFYLLIIFGILPQVSIAQELNRNENNYEKYYSILGLKCCDSRIPKEKKIRRTLNQLFVSRWRDISLRDDSTFSYNVFSRYSTVPHWINFKDGTYKISKNKVRLYDEKGKRWKTLKVKENEYLVGNIFWFFFREIYRPNSGNNIILYQSKSNRSSP